MEERNERTEDGRNRLWKLLLAITATVFMAIALVTIIVDQKYYIGMLYLITSILYFSSAYLIATDQARIKRLSSEQTSLIVGFIIIAIGLILSGPFWGLGFVLFLAAILSIRKSTD